MSLKISIVIAAYKSGRWIGETIDSILQQTYPLENLELIVVDDASPDDTVAVVRKLLDAAPIKSQLFVREKNSGLSSNRNVGWRAAEGDWIQFLDHDDLLLPHKLQAQAEFAAKASDDVAVLYSRWRHLALIDGTWQPAGPVRAPYVDEDTVPQILIDPWFGYLGPAIIRKSAVTAVNGFAEAPNLGDDSDMMLRLAIAGWRFRAVDSEDYAFLYRQTPGSLWRTYSQELDPLWNLLLTFRTGEQFLRERAGGGLREDVRRALAAQYGRRAPVFLYRDPKRFSTLQGWLDDLGYPVPPELSTGMTVASKMLGYRNALRLRTKYVALRDRHRNRTA